MRHWLLPLVLPAACAWLAEQERRILDTGVPLSAAQLVDARALGVAHPERVRLLRVARVPLPTNGLVRALGLWTGTLSERSAGLAARYGIFVQSQFWGEREVVAHELVHTRQYERLGGIRPFLARYLRECLVVGYYASEMELEAMELAGRLCL